MNGYPLYMMPSPNQQDRRLNAFKLLERRRDEIIIRNLNIAIRKYNDTIDRYSNLIGKI
jgi:hypothetical protein